jgi:hypothetical protein
MAGLTDGARAAAAEIAGADPARAPDQSASRYLEAFYALAQLTPVVSAPPELWREISQRRAARSRPDDPAAKPSIRRRRVNVPRLRLLRTTSLILLVVALALSVTVNILFSRRDGFRPETAVYLSGTEAAPRAVGSVLMDGDALVLHTEGLAELTSGNRYVAWAADGAPVWLGSLTMLDSRSARLTTRVATPPESIIVTIETSASPSAPSGPLVLTGTAR